MGPRPVLRLWLVLMLGLLLVTGCAKYNTYYNAKRAFDEAEHVRDEAIHRHEDPPAPSGAQKTSYLEAIAKAQKILDDYPGHSLTDDALFLQAKAHNRLGSYRQSVKKLDLLFLNFPATKYQEEALYLQALNYLMIGALDRSQEYLDKLATQFPDSKFQSETLKVSGDNSYTLKDWDAAAQSYRAYLDEYPKDPEVDRIGLKLAECYWELKDYPGAAEVLDTVVGVTKSTELSFRARLLLGRVRVRLGDFETTDQLLGPLEKEAPIYHSEGEVLLVRAENLVAQDRGDEASPLIENMPAEWNTPTVKTRAADILGYLYLQRGDLEKANEQFAIAVRGRDELEDYNKTRILSQNLKDYLAADQALPDARPERVPRLKLLKANALLFGFERPGEAGQLFAEAGTDSAADSLLAPRGLYGAVIVYRDYLDQPDSADIFARLLEEKYPDSPQAFEVRTGDQGDLMGFLLARQDSNQAAYLASLSPEKLAELQQAGASSGGTRSGRGNVLAGVRRRMVYLSRRDNLLFDPPAGAAEAAQAKLEASRLRQAQEAADIKATDEKLRAQGVFGTDQPDSFASLKADSLFQVPVPGTMPDSTVIDQPEAAREKKEEPKKEKEDDGGFDLR